MRLSADLKGFLARAGKGFLSLAFPEGNLCHLCGQPMLQAREIWLCDPCREALLRAAIPPEDQPLFLDPMIPCSVSAYRYHSPAQELVQSLKYHADRAAAAPLAEGMAGAFARADSPALRRAEALIPVPLHPKRELARGYNQAAVLAEQLAFHLDLPCYSRALGRIRYTQSQVAATRNQRTRNMVGAFTVESLPLVYGKSILLVDDVCTTGATAIACAQALLASGAKEVSLLTACQA